MHQKRTGWLMSLWNASPLFNMFAICPLYYILQLEWLLLNMSQMVSLLWNKPFKELLFGVKKKSSLSDLTPATSLISSSWLTLLSLLFFEYIIHVIFFISVFISSCIFTITVNNVLIWKQGLLAYCWSVEMGKGLSQHKHYMNKFYSPHPIWKQQMSGSFFNKAYIYLQ